MPICQVCEIRQTGDKYTYTCEFCSKKPKGMNKGGGFIDRRDREHDCHGRGYDHQDKYGPGEG